MSWQLSTTTAFFPPSVWKGQDWKGKSEKEGSPKTREESKTQGKQVMQMETLATNWLMPSQSLSSSPATTSPQFYCWACYHMIWDIPLVSWGGHLSWLCPFPTSYTSPALSLACLYEEQNGSWLCASSAITKISVINPVFNTNPNTDPQQLVRRSWSLSQLNQIQHEFSLFRV